METPTPAPYGHACANCVRSKCKCVVHPGKSICERCSRLAKECSPATHVRKRRTRPTPTPKRAKLEDKLENLVTLLQAQNSAIHQVPVQQVPSPHSLTSSVETTSQRHNNGSNGRSKPLSHAPKVHRSLQGPLESLFYEVPHPTTFPEASGISTLHSATRSAYTLEQNGRTPQTFGSAISNQLKHLTNPSAVSRSSWTDHQILQFFRAYQLPHFPCIMLPPDDSLNLETWKRSYPFLWENIQAISEPSMDRLSNVAVQIREKTARKVVIEGERSMDVLMGLQVHISWAHFFARNNKPHLGMMSGIIRSLVADLRLDGYAGSGDMPPPLFACPKLGQEQTMKPPTYEEERALLGCFIISSGVSSLLKYETMRWGSRMEEAAAKLGSAPECPNDQVLSALARLSRVADDATKVARCCSEDSVPAIIHVKSLRESLDKARSSLANELLSNKSVLCFLYNAEVMVYELSFYSKRSPIINCSYDIRRVEYIHYCFEAAKSNVRTYLTFDIAQLGGMNFFIMLQVLHSIHILFRLSILDDPEWDNSIVRNTAEVLSCLDQICSRLDQIHLSYGGEGESIWSNGAQRLRNIIPMWRASVAQEEAPGSNPLAEFASDPTLIDEGWFADIFPFDWNGQLERDST